MTEIKDKLGGESTTASCYTPCNKKSKKQGKRLLNKSKIILEKGTTLLTPDNLKLPPL